MPIPVFKYRTVLAALLLFGSIAGLVVFVYTLSHKLTSGVSQDTVGGMLVVLAGVVLYLAFHLLLLVAYLVFGLLLALLLLSPLLLFVFWLLRRRKRKRVARDAYLQFQAPTAPPQEKPIPLIQRRFRH